MTDAYPPTIIVAETIPQGAIVARRIDPDDPETKARFAEWAENAKPLLEWSDREEARRAALPWWRRKFEDWGFVRSGREAPPHVDVPR